LLMLRPSLQRTPRPVVTRQRHPGGRIHVPVHSLARVDLVPGVLRPVQLVLEAGRAIAVDTPAHASAAADTPVPPRPGERRRTRGQLPCFPSGRVNGAASETQRAGVINSALPKGRSVTPRDAKRAGHDLQPTPGDRALPTGR